jgi:hypothetical protein
LASAGQNQFYDALAGSFALRDITAGATRLIVDSSGNVGIGQAANLTSKLTVKNSITFDRYGDATEGLTLSTNSGNAVYNTFGGENHVFQTAGTERMRLDTSGNLLVGTTSAVSSSKVALVGGLNTYNMLVLQNTDAQSGGQLFQLFLNSAGNTAGSISHSGTTAVLYNVTSDYRLKDVIGAVSGAGERIDALEPIAFSWKADGSQTRGFLAHKFQEVYANSVTGIKDAVDADGNPVYQAMQAGTSEVIADLVAEIQSLRKRLTALEST